MIAPLWLVPLVPLLAATSIAGASRWLSSASRAGIVATVAAGIAAVLALSALTTATSGSVPHAVVMVIPLAARDVTLGLQADPLSSSLAVLVGAVSATVFAYSVWYMRHEPAPARFFSVMSLFAAAMLLLVLADNYLLLYAAWEIVGICSYLLIGHHWREPTAASAALKALLVTRIGDMALMLGVACLFLAGGTWSYDALFAGVSGETIRGPLVTGAGWLLIGGALGKSAQAPLHVWLPDAMAGPTPVSALLHSATMVAAGMYLVARSFPILVVVPSVLTVWLFLTALTACGAALAAAAQSDVKRVLAYSTMSQLGEMGVGIGIAAPTVAMVHLVAHATFKALLFLAVGVAMKASSTNELRDLGRVPRIAAIGFFIGALSLSGIPPFAGFWSHAALTPQASGFAAVILSALAPVSAFYIARAFFIAFRHPRVDGDGASRWQSLPIWMLGIATSLVGFVPVFFMNAKPGWLPPIDARTALDAAAALIGWWLAYALYERRAAALVAAAGRLRTAIGWARTGFGVEALARWPSTAARAGAQALGHVDREIFDRAARGVATLMTDVVAGVYGRVERGIFDRAASGVAAFVVEVAGMSRRVDEQGLDRHVESGAERVGRLGTRVAALQTGRVYHYLFAIFASIAAAAISALIARVWR